MVGSNERRSEFIKSLDLIDAVESMPQDDQSMLVELINKRIIKKRRARLVAEVQEARSAFKRGEVKRAHLKI
jgi:hypothetical protein